LKAEKRGGDRGGRMRGERRERGRKRKERSERGEWGSEFRDNRLKRDNKWSTKLCISTSSRLNDGVSN